MDPEAGGDNWTRYTAALATGRSQHDDEAQTNRSPQVTPEALRQKPNTAEELLMTSTPASVKAVQRMLGARVGAMTLDVYAGLFTTYLDAVADRR